MYKEREGEHRKRSGVVVGCGEKEAEGPDSRCGSLVPFLYACCARPLSIESVEKRTIKQSSNHTNPSQEETPTPTRRKK